MGQSAFRAYAAMAYLHKMGLRTKTERQRRGGKREGREEKHIRKGQTESEKRGELENGVEGQGTHRKPASWPTTACHLAEASSLGGGRLDKQCVMVEGVKVELGDSVISLFLFRCFLWFLFCSVFDFSSPLSPLFLFFFVFTGSRELPSACRQYCFS